MNENKMNHDLGVFLKDILRKNSLSIRKFSESSKIDKATLSRIINNKQKANINHLTKISTSLNIPLKEVLLSAGYDLEKNKCNVELNRENLNDLDSFLSITKMISSKDGEDFFNDELKKYEEWAKTKEGSNLIYENFEVKIKSIKGRGVFIEKLEKIYERFSMKSIPIKEKVLIGGALLYFITVPDILPDFLIPAGFLDDFIALKIVIGKVGNSN